MPAPAVAQAHPRTSRVRPGRGSTLSRVVRCFRSNIQSHVAYFSQQTDHRRSRDVCAAAATNAYALSIELKDAAPDRVERQRAAAIGRLPLPVHQTSPRRPSALQPKVSPPVRPCSSASSRPSPNSSYGWKGRPLRTLRHVSDLPLVGNVRTQAARRRQADARRVLHDHLAPAASRRRWPRSLNLVFPNAFDQAMGRSGSYILVHGGCSSVGCFAMTNPVIGEIYGLAAAALRVVSATSRPTCFPSA